MYEPLETIKCKKCGKIIAEPKELIRTVKRLKA
jgi:ribosomal protein S27E